MFLTRALSMTLRALPRLIMAIGRNAYVPYFFLSLSFFFSLSFAYIFCGRTLSLAREETLVFYRS